MLHIKYMCVNANNSTSKTELFAAAPSTSLRPQICLDLIICLLKPLVYGNGWIVPLGGKMEETLGINMEQSIRHNPLE